MNSAVQQALVWAALIATTLAGISVLLVYSCWRASRGSLALAQPNGIGWRGNGIKTPSTLRSEQAWLTGNRAAARTAPLYVLFNAAVAAALFAAAWHGWRLVVVFIGGGGFFIWMGLVIWTSVVASRAARAVPDDRSTHRSAVREGLGLSEVNAPFSGRGMTILGWVCAVAACGLTVFLLGTNIYGYVLATHHRLQPNSTFGFRDDISFSCLPRWYAAQKAGFTWMLFGYGSTQVVSLLVCTGAAIKRRSPWEICLLVLGTVFVAIIFLVAAGIHADSVARRITC
jgi:threonine/homoserine/homoserine lactone efflux protein